MRSKCVTLVTLLGFGTSGSPLQRHVGPSDVVEALSQGLAVTRHTRPLCRAGKEPQWARREAGRRGRRGSGSGWQQAQGGSVGHP